MKTEMIKLGYISSNVLEVQKKLLSGLTSKGIKSTLLSFSMRKNGYRYDIIPDEIFYECNSVFRGPFFYRHRLKRVFNHFYNEKCFDDFSILHANMMSADGYICRLAHNKLGTPYVLSVRNTDINLGFLWMLPWLKKMCFQNLIQAKKIVFLCKPYMKSLFLKLGKRKAFQIADKCVVIPNGIDNFWFDNMYNVERKINVSDIKLLTIGRIEKNKNQLGVAQAVKRLIENTGLRFTYTIVGEPKDAKIIRRLKKYSFVVVKDHMCKEELIKEFRHNDIYIMPSHKETFGLVYAEALSQGMPVIYSKGQGFDDQFPDGDVGFSCDSTKIPSICNSIIKTIDNYADVSRRSVKKCHKFNWDEIADALKKLYQ